ncbi:retrovirus-related pol polyprotein from transposon TNT 1-94, partial [Tanacetum coccineum]
RKDLSDVTSLPPGHSLSSSEHSSRYPSPSDLANSMSIYSKIEDIHHHPDSGAFSYGSFEEEVYVTQLKGFEDPHFPKHVYRVVKALYGLHQAP